ncbi:MAG: hypothetical protein FJ109_02740 [Deltaproteobacteria bacterium]|nr:hypothetical protein [Deltaproteobacteria bacterium]
MARLLRNTCLRRTGSWGRLLFASWVAVACSTSHPGKPAGDADLLDADHVELADSGRIDLLPDLADRIELLPGDLGEVAQDIAESTESTWTDLGPDGDADGGAFDADADSDAGGDADGPDVGPGFPFGEPCGDDSDCGKGVCLATPVGDLCSRDCSAGCPEGWQCWLVVGGDLCVPPQKVVCDECLPEIPPQFDELACLPVGDTYHLILPCGEEEECPGGLECGEVACPAGLSCPPTACLPVSGRCDCLPMHVGTDVPCILANAWGTCSGLAPCLGESTGACEGKKAKQEVCNGQDDDCDGLLDEATPDCKPSLCVQDGTKFYLQGAEVCVAGKCAVLQDEALCGLYACDKVGVSGSCLTSCAKPSDCVVEAYCGADGACHLRKPDGQPCSEGFECISEHCNHGICCAAGDCCFDAGFCPKSYESKPVCDDAQVCQGHRQAAACVNLMCQAGPNVADDSACDETMMAADCWPFPPVYCNGLEKQFPPPCAKACLADADCGLGSHCDSTCKPDLADGYSCDEDSDCLSGHCDSKICCAGGVCCNTALGCKALFSTPPACIDPAHCQGSRADAVCLDHVCSSLPPVPDDSACTGDILANDCGAAADYYCNGDPVQAVPDCAYECTGPADCDKDQQCLYGTCIPRYADGAQCDGDVQCLSGHCGNGFCCTAGDCCNKPYECPKAYSTAPLCGSPQSCQGTRVDATCTDHACGSVGPLEDDTACGKDVLAKSCAPYPDQFCTGAKAQPVPTCGSTCKGDQDCVAGAHCDDVCKPDLPDGMSCDEPSDCQSGHCQNGFCCDTGDCCQAASDCPDSWHAAPTCDIPPQCQGHRLDAICASFQCKSISTGDDSACDAGVPAGECGPYAALACTGKLHQTAPTCAVSCAHDADCSPGHHCDIVCLPDVAYGGSCDEDSDCQSGHCANGFCCDAGTCCSVAADCPGSFATPATCQDPSSCQGSRTDRVCTAFACDSVNVDDDSACTDAVVVDECGPYPSARCSGKPSQAVPGCATQCTQDAQCDAQAHCDGTCQADVGPSAACDEDSDCTTGHCANGFCCAQGDCCAVAADCPPGYHSAATCDSSATCQGHRVDAACADAMCKSLTVDDDSACTVQVLADDCGPNPDIHCDGTVAQTPPKCSAACNADQECGAGYHCDTVCKPDVANGLSCDEDSDCVSSHCANGFCCQAGDCCQFSYHCPASYSEAAACEQPAQCQGKRKDRACVQSMCLSQPVEDDSACAANLLALACGAPKDRYCTGEKYQAVTQCPVSCQFDSQCDPDAHCDGTCIVDLPDGTACDESTDCQSGHCGNGFCCSGSTCCSVAADCPGQFASPPACGNPATCQGTRQDRVCSAFVCGSTTMNDDSACTPQVKALDCGLFADRQCSGAKEQPPPACDVACTLHGQCDPSAHCDGSACVADLADGAACDEDSDCQSSHCAGGVCCKGGDCCLDAKGCPAAYSAPAICQSPATCQGERVDAACTGFVCGAKVVADDSACGPAV